MPYGSRGRQVLAQGKIMGKFNAALRLTVPHSDRAVEDGLAAIQKHADRTVFGKRHWLTLAAAKQPRDCMGVGHLDVKAATQAGWLKPLLAAAGQTQDQRPFKSYYCAYAREAYPALGMGRELLTLNLGFHRVVALPPEAIPGEAKHAFAAYATLPPLTYLEPDEDSGCVPRERMRYEELVRQPLLLNPLLESEPRRRRATAKEEDECLWWAQHGLRRVGDVLTADGKRVLTYTELVSRHAGLADDQMPAPRLRAMHTAIVANLNRWRKTLAKGPPKVIRRGQFRWGPSGEVLRATSTPATGAAATSAKLYEEQPHTGLLAATDQTRDLPAAPTDSEPCPVICMECEDSDWDADSDSDSDDEPYSTPEKVEEALGHQFRHALLAPWAMQPTPDPRLLGWRRPATMTPARDVCLAYASGKDVRLTLIALAYAEPRVFAQGGRLASLLVGLSQEQRRRRLAAIAGGMKHSVIPQEESHHLYVTVHHGHLQGQMKCRGDKGLCARCLQRGDRHEEGVMHEYHECLEAKAVWAKVASDWLEATGNVLDVSSPLLTVTGLRLPAPGSLSAEARARFDALEPAWRLVHSVALLKLHQARTRAHMAYHAEPQRQPKKTSTRDVMRAVKQRVLQRVEFEYSKAKHAATFSRDPRPLSRFFATWIATGVVAAIHKGQPRLRLFSAPQPETLPSPGTLHIRTCGAYVKTKGKRGPGSGFSLTAHEVQADGTETLVLTASGAVPTVATHGAKAPPSAASQHTPQVAQHAAALAGLACAEHALANGWNVRTTLGSETTHRTRL